MNIFNTESKIIRAYYDFYSVNNYNKLKNSCNENINSTIKNVFNKRVFFSKRLIDSFKLNFLASRESLLKDNQINIGSLTLFDLKNNLLLKETKIFLLKNIFSDFINDFLNNNLFSIKEKKDILDLISNERDIIYNVFKNYNTLNNDIKNYLLSDLNLNYRLILYLLDTDINNKLKEEIMIKKINNTNLFKILNESTNTSIIKFLLNAKKEEINTLINNLTKEEFITIINYNYNNLFMFKTYELRKNAILNILKINNKNALKVLNTLGNSFIIDKIIEKYTYELNNSIRYTNPQTLIKTLEKPLVKTSLKEEIILRARDRIIYYLNKIPYKSINYYFEYNNRLTNLENIYLDVYFNEIVNEINNSSENILKKLCYINNETVKTLIIKNKINKENILFNIKNSINNNDNILIIENTKDILISLLKEKDIESVLTLQFVPSGKNEKNKIIEVCETYYQELIKKTDLKTDYLSLIFSSNKYPQNIKKLILKEKNIVDYDIDNVILISSVIGYDNTFKYIKDIINFFNKINFPIDIFLQYGLNSFKNNNNLSLILPIIINNNIDNFVDIYYYFNNYFINSNFHNVNKINNLLKILNYYNYNSNICNYLYNNNIKLTEEILLDLDFIIDYDIKNINNLESLINSRIYLINRFKRLINKENKDIYRLKELINSYIFCDAYKIVSDIGYTRSLLELREVNKHNKCFRDYIDSIIEYVRYVDTVDSISDINILNKVINKFIMKTDEELLCLQNEYKLLGKKIEKLFELDAQVNLTRVSETLNIDGVLRKDLMDIYGGLVLDYSDKNYVLYAHIQGHDEKTEDLINGKTAGNNNFISMSPISYYGQTYYYDECYNIFAYDNIPDGSFIESSKKNLGTNSTIQNNCHEVLPRRLIERGIIETSIGLDDNSEVLLYREGLKPAGIILPGGREPNRKELEIHRKYDIPFIITQMANTYINSPKMVFKTNNILLNNFKENKINHKFDSLLVKENNVSIYTGREIAVLTDIHGLIEPTIAVLEDIRDEKINEIYSLGDNFGIGPSPKEVFDLLKQNKVISVLGNSEYYSVLGTEPFDYLSNERIQKELWTKEELGSQRIAEISKWSPSIDLNIGNSLTGLCHFINDVRWDYQINSTFSYQKTYKDKLSPKQFLFTNSDEAKKIIEKMSLEKQEKFLGYKHALNNPIFLGKKVTDYKYILQGHVHMEMSDCLNNTVINTLNALSLIYGGNNDYATYYILKEKKEGGFDIFRKKVSYNKELMIRHIKTTNMPLKEKTLSYVIK